MNSLPSTVKPTSATDDAVVQADTKDFGLTTGVHGVAIGERVSLASTANLPLLMSRIEPPLSVYLYDNRESQSHGINDAHG